MSYLVSERASGASERANGASERRGEWPSTLRVNFIAILFLIAVLWGPAAHNDSMYGQNTWQKYFLKRSDVRMERKEKNDADKANRERKRVFFF